MINQIQLQSINTNDQIQSSKIYCHICKKDKSHLIAWKFNEHIHRCKTRISFEKELPLNIPDTDNLLETDYCVYCNQTYNQCLSSESSKIEHELNKHYILNNDIIFNYNYIEQKLSQKQLSYYVSKKAQSYKLSN